MGAPAIHVAVVGSGPAGFYAAGHLLHAAGDRPLGIPGEAVRGCVAATDVVSSAT